MTFFHHITPEVSIPIPDKDIPAVLEMMAVERAKIKTLLEANVFDGGKEIRMPLEFQKDKI